MEGTYEQIMGSGTYFLVHTLERQGSLEDPRLKGTARKVLHAWRTFTPYEGMPGDIETLAELAGGSR